MAYKFIFIFIIFFFRWILFPPKQNGRDTKEILKERKLLVEDEEGECDSVPPLEWILKNYNDTSLKGLEYLYLPFFSNIFKCLLFIILTAKDIMIFCKKMVM